MKMKHNCETTTCPFALTDESEEIQNYGCLPTPYEIKTMRVNHGKTWACHSDNSKPCIGAIQALKKMNLPHEVIDKKLITEDDNWGKYCE